MTDQEKFRELKERAVERSLALSAYIYAQSWIDTPQEFAVTGVAVEVLQSSLRQTAADLVQGERMRSGINVRRNTTNR